MGGEEARLSVEGNALPHFGTHIARVTPEGISIASHGTKMQHCTASPAGLGAPDAACAVWLMTPCLASHRGRRRNGAVVA